MPRKNHGEIPDGNGVSNSVELEDNLNSVSFLDGIVFFIKKSVKDT
jgi:hypothetical protein